MYSKRTDLCILMITMIVFLGHYPGVLAKGAKAKASPAPETAAQKFIGTWQLVTSEFRSEDGKVAYPLGEKAAGILMCDSGGKSALFFSGLCPIRMSISEDDGQRWSELKPIGDFGGIGAMSSVIRLRNGDCAAFYHDDGRFLKAKGKQENPPKFIVYKTLSKYGGLTWSAPDAILSYPEAFLCEPGVIRSPDGKQLAMLLREESRRFNSFVSFSDDEGLNWSKPREAANTLTGDHHISRYAPDGRLFITFREMSFLSSTKGDWVGWVGTYEDIAKGRPGQYRLRLMGNVKNDNCGCAGLELLPDGTFVAIAYGHWLSAEPPYIVSVTFKMAELDAKAMREQKCVSGPAFRKYFKNLRRIKWPCPGVNLKPRKI